VFFEKYFKIFLEQVGPGLKETRLRSAQNKMQSILYWVGPSPAAWTGLMIQPGLVTVPMHSKQSIIISRLLCS